jgi:hypothetical protein
VSIGHGVVGNTKVVTRKFDFFGLWCSSNMKFVK